MKKIIVNKYTYKIHIVEVVIFLFPFNRFVYCCNICENKTMKNCKPRAKFNRRDCFFRLFPNAAQIIHVRKISMKNDRSSW